MDPKSSGAAGVPASTREMTSSIAAPAAMVGGDVAAEVVAGEGDAPLVTLGAGTVSGVRAVELCESSVCEQPATRADATINNTNRIDQG
jgi:hypothetical protein